LSATHLFSFWVALELNLILFLRILTRRAANEQALNIKYFLIQRVGSGTFLFRIFSFRSPRGGVNVALLTLSILLKLGAAPFQNWVLRLRLGLSWENFFLLRTIQKLGPLYLILQLNPHFGRVFVILGVVVACILVWGEARFKKLLALSSVFTIRWLFSASFSFRLIYFFVYRVSFYLLCASFFSQRLDGLQLNRTKVRAGGFIVLISLLALNFAGAPPFSLFFCKILILTSVLGTQRLAGVTLIFGRAIFVWAYSRFIVNLLTLGRRGLMWTPARDLKFLGLALILLGVLVPLFYLYGSLMR